MKNVQPVPGLLPALLSPPTFAVKPAFVENKSYRIYGCCAYQILYSTNYSHHPNFLNSPPPHPPHAYTTFVPRSSSAPINPVYKVCSLFPPNFSRNNNPRLVLGKVWVNQMRVMFLTMINHTAKRATGNMDRSVVKLVDYKLLVDVMLPLLLLLVLLTLFAIFTFSSAGFSVFSTWFAWLTYSVYNTLQKTTCSCQSNTVDCNRLRTSVWAVGGEVALGSGDTTKTVTFGNEKVDTDCSRHQIVRPLTSADNCSWSRDFCCSSMLFQNLLLLLWVVHSVLPCIANKVSWCEEYVVSNCWRHLVGIVQTDLEICSMIMMNISNGVKMFLTKRPMTGYLKFTLQFAMLFDHCRVCVPIWHAIQTNGTHNCDQEVPDKTQQPWNVKRHNHFVAMRIVCSNQEVFWAFRTDDLLSTDSSCIPEPWRMEVNPPSPELDSCNHQLLRYSTQITIRL